MPCAKLIFLLPLLLSLLQQSSEEEAPRIVLFVFTVILSFLYAGAFVLFLTVCFGVFAMPPVAGIRWLYRRSVLRWMSVPGGAAPAPEERPGDPAVRAPAGPNLRVEIHYSQAPHGSDDCPLSLRAAEASRSLTRVYLAAAVAYAAAMTPTALYLFLEIGSRPADDEVDLSTFGQTPFYLATFAVLLWLPLLTYLVVAVSHRWRKLIAVVAYTLLLSWPQLFLANKGAIAVSILIMGLWIFLMAAPTSTMLVLRFSGVGGLALATIFSLAAPAVLLGVQSVFGTFGPRRPAGGGESPAWSAADLGFLVALPAVALMAAVGLVWWMSRRYASKKTSEQILLMDVFWLFTTFYLCLVAYSAGAGWLTALGVAALGLYELIVWAGLRRLERGRDEGREELRLLLLRVFGARRRSEWLLKRLRYYWLYSGSIQLIAAPDLAAANLEMDELLVFLRGRLKSHFVKDARDSARRVESLDERPDPDGRYRVNEFFCHDDVWRETVAALARRSDAVLMDLRGFTEANRGCVHELRHLVDAVPVNRLVITVNEKTDLNFLRWTFENAWARMDAHSPNRVLAAPVLRLLHVTIQNTRAVRRLLFMLCEAAQVPRPPAALPEGAVLGAAPAGVAGRAA